MVKGPLTTEDGFLGLAEICQVEGLLLINEHY